MSAPTPRSSGRPRSRAPISGAAPLFDPALERNALERMLLAAATHASGPAFARAHLLVWNTDRAVLDGRLSWVGDPDRTWDEALAKARHQASEGTDPLATRRVRALRLPVERLEGLLGRAWSTRRAERGVEPGSRWAETAELGAVALFGHERPYGMVIGEWTSSGVERRDATLESYRQLANAAIAAHLQFEQSRRRAEHARAIGRFAQATVAPHNLAELGNLLVRLTAETTAARGAVLWKKGAGDALEVANSYGPAGVRDRLGRGLIGVAERSLALGRSIVIDRAVDAEMIEPEMAAQVSTLVTVPLVAYGRTLGALGVYDRLTEHPNESMAFDPEDVEVLAGLAGQCALAIEQARMDEERRRLEQARRDLLRQLMRSERLAAAGEVAARAARQARNPLAAIGAFARRVHRTLAAEDPNREYLEVVIRESDRLERALAEPVETPSPDGPTLRVESVNHLLQDALNQIGETLVRRRIRLLKKVSPDLPPLLLDAKRMQRVFENVLAQVMDRVHAGGRVRVETRRVQQFVVVEIATDGGGEPGDALVDLFVPFSGAERSDVGLGMARQVVWQHGGEVRMRSEAEWRLIFTLTLPIRVNEDRRRPGAERRVIRGDRRHHTPAS
jgi:nitrogen-specific signal transduction histidine kinase